MSSDEETFSEPSFDMQYKFAALDDCIRDAIAKEPLLRLPVADQDTVLWLGCLEEISEQKAAGCLEEVDKFSKTKLAVATDDDKQKISGRLSTAQPLEWQLKQCDECCEQYFSPVNLRRHAWIKHAKSKEMNILVTNNNRLSVYWDEKVEEETRQDKSTIKGRSTKISSDKLSFKELCLNDILDNVDNLLNTLDNRHKFYSAAHELKGLVLNQNLVRSSTLLSALHTLSERNSLQATRTPEMHEAMFGKDIKRVALEKENVLASLAFILEHYLVKSYDDDAAAKEPERRGFTTSDAESKKPSSSCSTKVKSNTKGFSKEIREVDNSNHEHNNEGKNKSCAQSSSEPTFGSSVNLPASIEQGFSVEEIVYCVHSPASNVPLQQEAVDALASAHDSRPKLGVPLGKQQQITSQRASQPQISLRDTVISSLKSLHSRGNPIQLSNASACSSDVIRRSILNNNEVKDNSTARSSSESTLGISVNLPASVEQGSNARCELSSPVEAIVRCVHSPASDVPLQQEAVNAVASANRPKLGVSSGKQQQRTSERKLSSPVEAIVYCVHSPASDVPLQQEAVDAGASAHDNRPKLGVPSGKQQQTTSKRAIQQQISLRDNVRSSLESLYSRLTTECQASACTSDVARLASILEVVLPASVEQGSDALFEQSNNNEVNDKSTAQSSSESTLRNSVNLPASVEQGSNARCELSSPVPLQQEAVDAVASAHDNRPKPFGVSSGKEQQITSQCELSSPLEAFTFRVHSPASLAANHIPLQQGSVDAQASAHERKLGVPSHKQHRISLYTTCNRVQVTSACHASASNSDVTQLAPILEVVLPASVEQCSDAICEQSSPVEAFVYCVHSPASVVANHVPLQQGSVDAQASAHEPKLGVPSYKQHWISLQTRRNTVQFTSACSSDVAQLAPILEVVLPASTSVPAPEDSLHSTPSVMVSTVPPEEKAPHAQSSLLVDGSNGSSSNLSEPADFNLQSPHADKRNKQQRVFASTKEWVSKTFASDQRAPNDAQSASTEVYSPASVVASDALGAKLLLEDSSVLPSNLTKVAGQKEVVSNTESLEIASNEDTQQVASLVPIADKPEVTPGVLDASVQEAPRTSDEDRHNVLVIPNATGSPFHGNTCTVVRDPTEVNQNTSPVPDVRMQRLSNLMSKRWKEFTDKGNYFRYVPAKIDPASTPWPSTKNSS